MYRYIYIYIDIGSFNRKAMLSRLFSRLLFGFFGSWAHAILLPLGLKRTCFFSRGH